MNRKGDWIQIFLVLFFVFLLVVGASLLFVQKDRLQIDRPEMGRDMVDQHINVILMNTLRLPISVDVNGDDAEEEVSLAVAFVLDDRENDEKIVTILGETMPKGASYRLETGEFSHEVLNSSRDLLDYGFTTKATLPGDITVSLTYADEATRTYVKGTRKGFGGFGGP